MWCRGQVWPFFFCEKFACPIVIVGTGLSLWSHTPGLSHPPTSFWEKIIDFILSWKELFGAFRSGKVLLPAPEILSMA